MYAAAVSAIQAPQNTTHSSPTPRLGWVSQPNLRGTVDIIWSCLIVLVVCVWSVLHLNLPAANDGEWTKILRKLRWASLAVCAPEILMLFASMQWQSARDSVKDMESIDGVEWSIVHGFFANSGGFLLKPLDMDVSFPINAKSLHYLCQHGFINPPEITREEIWDRSKADKFAKIVAFFTAIWLIVQCIVRATQDLAVTPFEITTMGFVVCTFLTGCFWLNKPQCVELAITLYMDRNMGDVLKHAEVADGSWQDTPMDFIEKPLWAGWKRKDFFASFGGLKKPLNREPNDYAQPPPRARLAIFTWLWAMLYASIHVCGWNFSFATEAERILWRSCSITMLVVLALGGFVPVISTLPGFDHRVTISWIWVREVRGESTFLRRWLFDAPEQIAALIYTFARLGLGFEMFFCFRSLPSTSFDTINWMNFVPHV